MGRQLELLDKSSKTHKVNVQDAKITHLVNELIKCLPDKKLFGMQLSIMHVQNI